MPQFDEEDDIEDQSAPVAPISVKDAIAARLAKSNDSLQAAQYEARKAKYVAGMGDGLSQALNGLARAAPSGYSPNGFKEQYAAADAPVDQFQERQKNLLANLQQAQAQQKFEDDANAEDPTSDKSKNLQASLGTINPAYKSMPATSAADQGLISKTLETQEATKSRLQQRQMMVDALMAKAKMADQSKSDAAGAKANQASQKADSELATKESQLGSRGGNAKYVDALRRADNIQNLLGQYPDLNQMPLAQKNLLYAEIDGMVNGGAPTEGGMHGITPSSYLSGLRDLIGKSTNQPVGAELGAFLKPMVPYISDVQNSAKKHLLGEHQDLIDGYQGRISEDAYKRHSARIQQKFGTTAAPASNSPTAPFSDPDKEARYQAWKAQQGQK